MSATVNHPISLRCLIVDDERLSRQYLRNLLAEFAPEAETLDAGGVKEAFQILSHNTIDVLFLDIRMSDRDGFSLLEQMGETNIEIVFVTAYSEYAIKAIKNGASDYLLKPVRKTEFRETLNKVMHRVNAKRSVARPWISEKDKYLMQRLAINHLKGTSVLVLRDIVYLKAENTYTRVFYGDSQVLLVSKPMKWFEEQLKAPWFFRIHKSIIINIEHLRAFSSAEGYWAVMSDKVKLPVSRYRLTAFNNIIKMISGA